jgi:hypothetical protein
MFPRFHVIARRPRLLVMSSASLLVALAAAPSFAERSSARSDTPPALVPLRSVSPAAVAPAATSSSAAAASGPVRVHLPGMSPCPPSAGPEPEFVWCFEGAGGDSTWPANPGGTSWRHWSRFAPPGPQSSRWHVTTKHGGVSGGTYNAWAGCDSVGTNPGCADVGFWVFQEGYGDDWNEVLEIQCSGQNTTSGGAIEFDLRYDAECVYDYLYLEYLDNGTGQWKPVLDGGGNAAVFNGTSGNPGAGCDNGGGGANEGNYFDDVGVYGSSSWYENVSFPLPAQAGDTHVRWRADSDPASSDQDGRADTDGLAAIDNLTLTFTADGATVTDDFETGDFLGVGASAGTAAWNRGLAGNTYDGWHLSFDPMYKGKGPTCLFDDTWMWAAKPDVGAIQEDQFDFFLVSPTIDVSGWSAGWVTWHGFQCDWTQSNHDLPTILVRVHDTALGWSPWEQFDGFLLFVPVRGLHRLPDSLGRLPGDRLGVAGPQSARRLRLGTARGHAVHRGQRHVLQLRRHVHGLHRALHRSLRGHVLALGSRAHAVPGQRGAGRLGGERGLAGLREAGLAHGEHHRHPRDHGVRRGAVVAP